MSEELWDFDAGWKEAEGEPLRFRFLGREWEVSRDVPAELILKLDRLMLDVAKAEEAGGELPDDFVIDESMTPEGIARQLVGGEMVDEWLKLGVGHRRFLDISAKLMRFYRGEDPMAEEPEPDPNRKERRAQAAQQRKSPQSSGTGARSRRTSPGSTARTSTTSAARTRSGRSGRG
jgi:hypothetical protein